MESISRLFAVIERVLWECRAGCWEQPGVCRRRLQAGRDVWDVVESKTLACAGLWGVQLLNADLSEGGCLG